MQINFYNSLSNQIEPFKPLEEGKVSCYVCGPTVYNYVHFGNMRPVVVFDVLRRFLAYLGYQVTFISNFTDIDDKIVAQAQKEGLSEKEIAEKYIKAFEEDRQSLNALKPTYQPRVTETIPEIIAFIEKLVEKGYAYVNDGDVYFRVSKLSDYGQLSNIKVEDLLAGARIEDHSKKEAAADFALWKKVDQGITFPSPWGEGRPGWHTECVVMINNIIPGGHIDIHGGGFDLKFPHHTNEIAQSEAINNHKIANYWMHNGFINLDNVKMSKSLGNVKQAKELIAKYGGNVIRFMLINAHYRAPVNFSDELVQAAKKELDKIVSPMQKAAVLLQMNNQDIFNLEPASKEAMNDFLSALADDLNTSNALTELYKSIKVLNGLLRSNPLNVIELLKCYQVISDMTSILGIQLEIKQLSAEDKKLLNEYQTAKDNKDFAKSDQLRKRLIEKKLI